MKAKKPIRAALLAIGTVPVYGRRMKLAFSDREMKDHDSLIDLTQETASQSKVSAATAKLLSLAYLALSLTAGAQSTQPDTSNAASEPTVVAKPLEVKHQETWATCRLLVWINAVGRTQAAQVINPYGASLLEQSCLNLAIGQVHHSPPNSERADYRWATTTINWVDPRLKKNSPPPGESPLPVPELARDQVLHVDFSHYPAAALSTKKEGVCAIHIGVDAAGVAQSVTLTRSTGTPELDSACLQAIREARFKPARRGDQEVAATTDVWLRWLLP